MVRESVDIVGVEYWFVPIQFCILLEFNIIVTVASNSGGRSQLTDFLKFNSGVVLQEMLRTGPQIGLCKIIFRFGWVKIGEPKIHGGPRGTVGGLPALTAPSWKLAGVSPPASFPPSPDSQQLGDSVIAM